MKKGACWKLGDILVITNADMSLQSGNIVLISRRAEEIHKQFNIKTTCMMILKKDRNVTVNHKFNAMNYIVVKSKKAIAEYININSPKCIIFYGYGSYMYISFVKKITKKLNHNIKFLLDVQGAFEEMIEYNKGFRFMANYFKYVLKKRMFSRFINMVDGIFVVSNELMKYCYSFLDKENEQDYKIFKIRCGINKVISTNQKMQWRSEIRKLWNIDDSTIVMVFSGYRMAWQNIDKIIRKFQCYGEKEENIFYAFFCNIDDEFEDKIKNSFPRGNYELKFLSFNEYYKYLCACDVGFLIRDYNITNKVAFPNKFADYLNAGLMVAINKALPEPYRILKNYDVDYIDIEDKYDFNLEKIKNRQDNILKFYKTTEQICRTELLYSKQIMNLKFDEFLSK